MRIKLYLLTIAAIALININSNANTTQDVVSFEKQFNVILHNLDSIITNSENQHETVKKHFDFIKSKIYNNELAVVYDTSLNYDFFGCSSFNISVEDNESVGMSFGDFIIDKYDKHPTLVYAILINTFQYAYDYYNNKELFLIATSNPIEKTYFEIDALMLEAIFLYVYMKDKENLGYIEKYLMVDVQNNMLGSATLFKKTDIDLLHKIDNLNSIDKSSNKLLKEFNNIGKELIKTANFENKSDWENYCTIVTLKTYVYYSNQVIFDIVHSKDNVDQDSFSRENYPKNIEVVDAVREIIGVNKDFLSYYSETMKLYSEYYK